MTAQQLEFVKGRQSLQTAQDGQLGHKEKGNRPAYSAQHFEDTGKYIQYCSEFRLVTERTAALVGDSSDSFTQLAQQTHRRRQFEESANTPQIIDFALHGLPFKWFIEQKVGNLVDQGFNFCVQNIDDICGNSRHCLYISITHLFYSRELEFG